MTPEQWSTLQSCWVVMCVYGVANIIGWIIIISYLSGIAQRTRWTDTTVDKIWDFLREDVRDDLAATKTRLDQIVQVNQERDKLIRAVAGIKVDVK